MEDNSKSIDSVKFQFDYEDDDEETVSNSFICCVCLDILHKPIVLDCGHVACFWCVHKSMNGLYKSHCPICRHSYHHFPTVCEMLHFLLLKVYPVAYRRREKQVLEEEKRTDCFSPQLDAKEETCSKISRTDVLCPACKQILFRPAVLNCGHVYCEACIAVPEDGIIICTVCESPHPTDFPNVFLELNNFLEEKFPEEYGARRQSIQQKQAKFQHKNPPACSSSKKSAKKGFPTGEDFMPWWKENGSKVHRLIGCDYCGMFPIVGDRYRCRDCKEQMGFDLCGDCYNTSSKRPGRFNQHHTPEHRMELVKPPNVFQNIMARLVGDHLIDSSGAPILAISATEDSPDGWIAIESAVADAVFLDGVDDDDVSHGNETQGDPTSMESGNAPETASNAAVSPSSYNNNTQDDPTSMESGDAPEIAGNEAVSPVHHDDMTNEHENDSSSNS